jgi:hypothetical protein
MPRKPPRAFARIAITLPRETLELADQLARDQDRSRSWIIAESVRRLAGQALPPSVVRETRTVPSTEAVELVEARRQHLEANLRLDPRQRLARAQELVRLARLVHPRPARAQIIAFDRLDDFAAWKKSRQVAG